MSLTAVNGSAVVFECVTGLSAPQAMVSVERDGVTFTEVCTTLHRDDTLPKKRIGFESEL